MRARRRTPPAPQRCALGGSSAFITGLSSGERGLGQPQQVGDFLRCAAPIFYPYAGQTPIDDDEEARNTLQPSMHRSISCCASPHWRDAQRGALPAPHRREDRDEKIVTGTRRSGQALKRAQNDACPDCGNRCKKTTDGAAWQLHGAENPRANLRSAPKSALPRPPPTRQAVRKGRLNCL